MPAYYPTSPFPDVTDLITLIRAGQFSTQKPKAMKHFWHLSGYGLRVMYGDPDIPAFSASAVPTEDQTRFVNDCKSLALACKEAPEPELQVFGNDIIEFLDRFPALAGLRDVMATILKAIYDLIGREWKH